MPMTEYHFTERTRKVFALSRDEAAARGHAYIGTEHLLLGLIREGEGVASAALQILNIDLQQLVRSVDSVIKFGKDTPGPHENLPYTSRAKKVLELAIESAAEYKHAFVGTEHLLLGLIREEKGLAAQVLIHAGATHEGVANEILRLLGSDDKN